MGSMNTLGEKSTVAVQCEVCHRTGTMQKQMISDGSWVNNVEKPWEFWTSSHRGFTLVCSRECADGVAGMPPLVPSVPPVPPATEDAELSTVKWGFDYAHGGSGKRALVFSPSGGAALLLAYEDGRWFLDMLTGSASGSEADEELAKRRVFCVWLAMRG